MSHRREILVAVDFSDGSKAALEQAALIAKDMRAALHVLHVWQVPEFLPPSARSSDAGSPPLAKAIERQAQKELDGFVFEARARGIGIDEAFTHCGLPSSTIVEVAKQRGAELVVLGTHGR